MGLVISPSGRRFVIVTRGCQSGREDLVLQVLIWFLQKHDYEMKRCPWLGLLLLAASDVATVTASGRHWLD
jgi:hypothetical protein